MTFASKFRSAVAIASFSAAGMHPLTAQSAGDSQPQPRAVRFTLGAGVMTAPRYEGSDEYRVSPLPLASMEISDKVYLGFGSAGVYLLREQGFTGKFGVALSGSRSGDRADALAGTDKRSIGAFSISTIGYHTGWIDAGITGARSLGQHGYSMRGDFGVTLPVTRRFSLGLAMNATFSDRRNMSFDFGVSRREAARRSELIARGDRRLRTGEDRAYRPGAGLRSIGLGRTIGLQIGHRWGLVGVAALSRLGSQAAGSPLVRSRNGAAGGVGITFVP